MVTIQLRSLTTLSLVFLVTLSSCGKKDAATTTTDSSSATKSATASPASATAMPSGGKYKLKSAIVTSTMEMPTLHETGTTVLYFDNYGQKESLETTAEIKMGDMTIPMHSIKFNQDGFVYDIDLVKKTGRKIQGGAVMPTNDMSAVTPQMAAQYNIKKEGTETVAGRECDVISMNNAKMGMTGRVATWNGIGMKSDMVVSGMPMKMVVTKIEENASIPESKFQVPPDVKIFNVGG